MKVKIMLNTNITLKETRVYREIKEEGREEVREVMANSISLQLTKRFGELSGEIRSSISGLPVAVLEDLSAAVLDFTNLADLESWLAGRIN
ncbi:hypothetical protein NSP_15030 [Nodularia spumigena CCY9414]|jgi:predicted transposase YdaD|nr:hypothetical protein NSP_15030 [Nodularia spumigena CCY9414]EAW46805.1 hypothetical protein N9414_17548 [Nodularia spumigena CCY9414]